jgi:hypothetical protein
MERFYTLASAAPALVTRGGHTLPGDGAGGANSEEGTDTLVLKVLNNPSTVWANIVY